MDWLAAWIGRVTGWGAGLSLFAMAAVCALQVVCRYLLNAPLRWPEEVARLLLVWLTYLGAVSATESGLHVAIGIVRDRFSPRVRWAADLAGDLVAVLFFAALTVGGLTLLASMRGIRLPALQVPLNVVCAAVPVAGALHVYLHAAAAIRGLRAGPGVAGVVR